MMRSNASRRSNSVAAVFTQRRLSNRATSWLSGLPGLCTTTACLSVLGVGSIAGQPSRRLACPSSVASRIAPQTLYLASRRPRASATPQPPVDSQLTLTVSNISAKCSFLCLLDPQKFTRLQKLKVLTRDSKKEKTETCQCINQRIRSKV